jgi:hypothetical protein
MDINERRGALRSLTDHYALVEPPCLKQSNNRIDPEKFARETLAYNLGKYEADLIGCRPKGG